MKASLARARRGGDTLGTFGCEQVHGNRVARKGVDHQHVEVFRRLVLEPEACIAFDDCDGGLGVGEVGEVRASERDDLWVYFVEAELVAVMAVAGERTCAESDDACS